MRIVVDTNVIASAIFFGGKPYQLLKPKYPSIGTRIPLQELLSRFEIIRVSSDTHVSRDSDDDKFISCAVDGKCLYIVSGDCDLLSIGSYADIGILTVADFLNRLEEL